jgi:hypothetical protein
VLILVLRLISEVEFKSTTVRVPVEGLKVNLVEDTFCAVTEPEVASVKVRYLVAFVEVSSVTAIPAVTVAQV